MSSERGGTICRLMVPSDRELWGFMEEEHLRAVVRERVRTGELPSVFGGKTFGGRGSNRACDCCHQIITHHEVEYEVELTLPFDSSTLTFIAHPQCHWIWREESGRAEVSARVAGFAEPALEYY